MTDTPPAPRPRRFRVRRGRATLVALIVAAGLVLVGLPIIGFGAAANSIDADGIARYPSAPAGTRVIRRPRSMALSWNAWKGANGYKVVVATDAKLDHVVVTKTTDKRKTIVHGLHQGTGYYYRVTPQNTIAFLGTSVSTGFATTTYKKVAAPRDVQVHPVSTSSATVTWASSRWATGYTVTVKTLTGKTQRYDVGGSTSYVLSGLPSAKDGASYTVRVTADNSGRRTAISKAVTGYALPSTPTDLRTVASSVGGFTIGWGAATNVGQYVVEVSDNADFTGAHAEYSVDRAATTFTLNGESAGGTHYIRVRAANGDVAGPTTGILTVNTAPTSDGTLAIGSYNVKNASVDAKQASWAQRRKGVFHFVNAGDFDVLGVQEAPSTPLRGQNGLSQIQDILEHSSSPHLSLAHADGGSNQILYNAKKLTALSSGSERLTSANKGERTLVWQVFRLKSTGARFFFATTHLQACKGSYCDAVRATESKQILRRIDAANTAGLPVVLTGDMNSDYSATESTPVTRFVNDGLIDGFREAAANADPTTNTFQGWSTTAVQDSRAIDHILTSPTIAQDAYTTLVDKTGSGSIIRRGSDHYAIRLDIRLPGSD